MFQPAGKNFRREESAIRIDSTNIESYFNLYKDSIFNIGFNWFRNPTDADDIVQETFFRLFRCNRDFESEAHQEGTIGISEAE